MIRYVKVRPVKSPSRGTAFSAGIDFFVPNDFQESIVRPNEDILIPSGLIMEIPEHCALLGVDKSGIASSRVAKERCGMVEKNANLPSAVIVGAKLIDADYPGEIHIHLINVAQVPIVIQPGQKIAQFMLVPVFYDNPIEVSAEEMHIVGSERVGGFGSTGK